MDEILVDMKRAGRAAFRTREYASLLGKKNYARLVLHRIKKKGEILLIRKGWWAFPGAIPEAVACEISAPCYVSFHSALFLHGLTTQTPRNVQVAVARRTRKYAALGIKVNEFRIKKSQFNNFAKKEGVLLASPEKAVADCLSLPRTCPEFIVLEAIGKVDVAGVARLLESKAAFKRLGKVIRNAGKERN